MNTNLTITGVTALQVYGSATIINGIDMNYQEGDEYYNFSVENGVAQNLVITNGGFYYSGDGTVIENSIEKVFPDSNWFDIVNTNIEDAAYTFSDVSELIDYIMNNLSPEFIDSVKKAKGM